MLERTLHVSSRDRHEHGDASGTLLVTHQVWSPVAPRWRRQNHDHAREGEVPTNQGLAAISPSLVRRSRTTSTVSPIKTFTSLGLRVLLRPDHRSFWSDTR